MMNIAILGKSSINKELASRCLEEGFMPVILENADDIAGFDGEKGNFIIKTSEKTIEAGFVIVSAESGAAEAKDAGTNENIPLPSLADINIGKFLGNPREPVVFILDYPFESPAYMTWAALDKAVALSRKRRKVICLARFIRTSASGLEEIYMEARNAGVTFIKYNDISVSHSEDEGLYHIETADDFGGLSLDTRFLAAGTLLYDENAGKIAGKLRLKTDENGFADVRRHFLYPVFTSRKGIYFVDAGMYKGFPDELEFHVKLILADIKSSLDPAGQKVSGCGYAEIDAGKCAFCYTCFRVCPHSAMAPDYENSVMKNLKNSCYACGICASACPARAIEIKGWEVIKPGSGSEYGSGLEHSSGSGAGSTWPGGGSIEILCCENSGEIAAIRMGQMLGEVFGEITVTPVSCTGEISVERIFSSLKNNSKVLVATCMENACRHFEGNKRARMQVERARELLKAAGGDEKRIGYTSLSHAMPVALADELDELLGISSR